MYKIGDEITLQEICPGAGISTQGIGKIVAIFDDGSGKAYMAEKPNGEYRLLVNQERWGYAYNYFRRYEKDGEGWKETV